MDHHQALSKAKINLMARPDSAFFTTIAFSLKHVWDEKLPTAATDGRTIWFSPKFFMSLNLEEQIFLLLHESMHVAYMHMARAKHYPNKRKANQAMDYVINLQLVDRGFKMPSCGLLDRKFAGMCWEEVYKLLPDDPPANPMDGDLREGEEDDFDEQLQKEVEEILVRASIQSKMADDKAGTIPGDIQIFLDRLLNPKLPWQKLVQKTLRSFDRSDYTMKKPNRRFFPEYHMPSLFGEKLMSLAVAVDTSGSVSDHDFNVFVTEIHSLMRMMQPDVITLIQFDTDIKSVDKIKSTKDLMGTKFTGRGGTQITPVIQWANENKPQLLLVFSDGDFRFYSTETKANTLWLIHNNERFTAPFGKVVHYAI